MAPENPVEEKPAAGEPQAPQGRGENFAQRIKNTYQNFKKSGEFFKQTVDEKADLLNQLVQELLNELIKWNAKFLESISGFFSNKKKSKPVPGDPDANPAEAKDPN